MRAPCCGATFLHPYLCHFLAPFISRGAPTRLELWTREPPFSASLSQTRWRLETHIESVWNAREMQNTWHGIRHNKKQKEWRIRKETTRDPGEPGESTDGLAVLVSALGCGAKTVHELSLFCKSGPGWARSWLCLVMLALHPEKESRQAGRVCEWV